MSEPTTNLKALIVPNTGDLVGAWGTAAINPDLQAIDGMLGGLLTLSLAAATTIALSAPAGAITPGAGPTQSQNALIRLTGTLTGNCVIQFTLPGFYIVENLCTVGTSYVQLAPASGTGNVIGAPPGRKCHVFFDGTAMDFANPPDPGVAYDLHGVTALPAWMTACTKLPYLIKDGSTYSTATYPALGALLGSTFGGNGASTFGVPDERSRMRLPVDTNGPGSYANRVTAAGSGINGTTLGAAGGNELMQAHTHTYTDPGHAHSGATNNNNQSTPGGAGACNAGTTTTGTATVNISIATAGTGTGQNMPPAIVSFLALIKT